MKRFLTLTLLSVAVLAQGAKVKMVEYNMLNKHLPYHPMQVNLHKISQLKPSDYANVIVLAGGKEIPSQVDDLNHDGTPETLSFLLDMPANGAVGYVLKTKKKHAAYKPEVYVDMIHRINKGKTPDQWEYVDSWTSKEDTCFNHMWHHGAAWESDIMAYRIYFDKRQSLDVYAKKTPGLELKESTWYPGDSPYYPADSLLRAGYGDDVLRIGSSVGCGTLKPWDTSKMQAEHYRKVGERTQRIVAKGPVCTIVEMELKDWEWEGKKINATFRYTMFAHHRDCRIDFIANQDLDNMVVGVQKVNGGQEGLLQEDGLVGCWGTDWPVNDTVKYAKETVGIGVYVPEYNIDKPVEDKLNKLYQVQYRKGNMLTYWITCYSMKEVGTAVKCAEDFWRYLKEWREEFVIGDQY